MDDLAGDLQRYVPFFGRDCDSGISRKEVKDLKNESKFIFKKIYNIKKSFCKMDIPSF